MKPVPGRAIEDAIYASGIACAGLRRDELYALPAVDWVDAQLSAAMRAFQRAFGLAVYGHEDADCDDFAGVAAEVARLLHRRMKLQPPCALAFGTLAVERAAGGHMLNMYVTAHPGTAPVVDRLVIAFYEPQERRSVDLSWEERQRGIGWEI
jgi:hypothetical protein